MSADLANLEWREPLWLWLALYPWLLSAARALGGRARGRRYADAELLPWARAQVGQAWTRRAIGRHVLIGITWLMFALALAGPRTAELRYDADKSAYPELMVVLDMSLSMTARDVAPSRLERAKLELLDLIARADQIRIGIVVYGARPHLLSPPTDDKNVLRHYLQSVRYGLLPTDGSDLAMAMSFAAQHYSTSPDRRAMLLVTDGELASDAAASQGALHASVDRLRAQHVAVYALGMGSLDGAALFAHDGSWLHDQGRPVVSVLHENRLRDLAERGGGRYTRVSDTDADWQLLYDQDIRHWRSGTRDARGDSLVIWREWFAWPLAIAVLLFLLSSIEARHATRAWPPAALFALLISGGLWHAEPALAQSEWPQRAYQAFQQQSYLEAKQAYARVPGYAGRMGEGGSAYQLGEYAISIRQFTQAVLDADNDAQRANAIFNLANSYYRLEDYDAAIALYREVLLYRPKDRSAQINLDYAVREHARQQQVINDGGSMRPGRGPRKARLADGTDVGRASLSIDDEAVKRTDRVPDPPGTALSTSELIERGIRSSQTAVPQAREFQDPTWHYVATPTERIVLQAGALRPDESLLWKRIFEVEENFQAPVEIPYRLPEMSPW